MNARNALRSVGDVDRGIQVVHENADDLTEPQGDNGEVIAAQLEHRSAEQDACAGRHRGGQRHDQPDRHVEAVGEHRSQGIEIAGELVRRQQGVQIRPHRVERDIAQIEQTGQTHHDVQAEGQHDVEHGESGDAHPGVAGDLQHQRQGDERSGPGDEPDPIFLFVSHLCSPQARSATRSPSRPCGRRVSTRISTMKAKMSW
ncbi:hypothetical protein GALL_519200 [mine drainage metagenome]|uniref:Uncharacterized protein n=1 Tax=mine drainage metagenome TaxID=410659 RepID=A0A1J5PG34_9ZZZZ